MPEDKQLTVAEILARAQQDNPDAGARRRRRRSLEEGGVSVAELTGSIKKVEARPVESRHSSVPIDAPAKPAENTATTAPNVAATAPNVATTAPNVAATPAPRAEQAAHNAARKTEQQAVSTPAKAAEEKPAGASSKLVRPAKPAKPVPERSAEPETSTFAKVTRPASKPGPAEDSTAVIKKVEAQPAPARKLDPAPTVAPAPVPADDFDPFAEDFTDATAADAAAHGAGPVEGAAADGVGLDDAAIERPAAEDVVVEEATVNPIMLVLLIFVGVLLGVLGFLAFKWIWAHTMAAVAALLGVAAVAGVVFGVASMKNGRDGLTMTLAGVAAAVAAFGPALI